MNKKFFSFTLVSTLIFSACGADQLEENVQKDPEYTKVVAAEVQKNIFTPVLEVSGTLKPKFETAIASETSGTVGDIYVSEGDEVKGGDTLLTFAKQDNLARIDLENAQIALNNAEKILDFTKKQAQESERTLLIAIDQAETSVANAIRTDTSTGESNEAQVESAKSGVELAKINLTNAEKNQKDLEENLMLQEENLQENWENIIANSMITFRVIYTNADVILGITRENRGQNDDFERFLGFNDPQSKIDATNSFSPLWSSFLELEAEYTETPENVRSQEIIELAEGTRLFLQKLHYMLQKSIDSNTFPQAQIDEYIAKTSSNRGSIESIIQSITTLDQQIEDFYLRKPQQIKSAELGVKQAQKQFEQSEKSLQQAKSGGTVSKVGSENQLSNAKSQLKSQKAQLDFQRKQNAVMIQNAQNARDNAANNVKRASLQFSKLSVTSSIDGVITQKQVEVGNSVGSGAALFVVAQTEMLSLEAEVPLEYISVLEKNDVAQVDIDVFGKRDGYVSKIFPVANELTRRVKIEITIENLDRKIPANIFASAEIPLPKKESSIMIPLKSLVSQNPAYVYVLSKENKVKSEKDEGEGKSDEVEDSSKNAENTEAPELASLQENQYYIEKRKLELGGEDGGFIEVYSGLEEEELYITEKNLNVKEGDIVEISKIEKKEEEKIKESKQETREEKTPENENENEKKYEQKEKISAHKNINLFSIKSPGKDGETVEIKKGEKQEIVLKVSKNVEEISVNGDIIHDFEGGKKTYFYKVDNLDLGKHTFEFFAYANGGRENYSEKIIFHVVEKRSQKETSKTKDIKTEEQIEEISNDSKDLEGLSDEEKLMVLQELLDDYEVKTFDKTFEYLEEETGLKMPRYQYRKDLYPFNTVNPTQATSGQIRGIIEIYLKDRFGEEEKYT